MIITPVSKVLKQMVADLSVKIRSDIDYIPYVLSIADSFAKVSGFDEKNCKKIAVSIEEALTNIIKYSYENRKDEIIIIELSFENSVLTMRLKHKGISFNLDDYKVKDIEQLKREKRKGGFGIFLIRKFVDELTVGEERGWKYYLMKKNLKK
jgi:anti-sigma regulatory factor (Ser/Thr protein kinase)